MTQAFKLPLLNMNPKRVSQPFVSMREKVNHSSPRGIRPIIVIVWHNIDRNMLFSNTGRNNIKADIPRSIFIIVIV